MVLRKQTADDTAFLDEVVPEVGAEVERQLASMRDLDDRDAPNFSDADYQLAAYAAALRVLTRYRAIDEVNLSYELFTRTAARRDEPACQNHRGRGAHRQQFPDSRRPAASRVAQLGARG